MADPIVPIPPRSHFSQANLPFGIVSSPSHPARPAVRLGDHYLDLHACAEDGRFAALADFQAHLSVLTSPTLNAFASLGRQLTGQVRRHIAAGCVAGEGPSPSPSPWARHFHPLADAGVTVHLPMAVADYTDFYAGAHHARNCGALFRSPDKALQDNYLRLPVGYHGRASSVVVSGTPVRRPCGQVRPAQTSASAPSTLAPTRKLDFELELGAFLCGGNALGERLSVAAAAELAVFGYVLLNDWSARDVQAWEYVPLGPFTAKNFGTSVSAWVVLADALEGSMCEALEAERELLPYLRDAEGRGKGERVLDMSLEVDLTTRDGGTTTLTKTNARNLAWSFPQMIAHHTVTGCNMQVGDLLGSGTISGTEQGEFGSLLEQSRNGKVEIKLNGGEERTFLEDGDTVTMRGWTEGREGQLIGFGECVGTIEPALVV